MGMRPRQISVQERVTTGKTIPVIAMTANVFQEDESRAAECGMSDYVTKPIDMNVIYSVLEKWLRGQKG